MIDALPGERKLRLLKAPIRYQALSYDRQTLTSLSGSVWCLIEIKHAFVVSWCFEPSLSSMRYSHQIKKIMSDGEVQIRLLSERLIVDQTLSYDSAWE